MTPTHSSLDMVWLLVCAALVMLMQAGFCCLESGFARAKNSINVAIKNFVDFCIASLLFWIFGFGLMFGASWHGLFGTTEFAPGAEATPWLLTFFIFQLVFCGTATTIISGAVAERTRFTAYLLISALVSGLFYPLFGHWAWAGADQGVAAGWLNKAGFIDFAGSTVVHSLGGWFSLAAVLIIGPRVGRFGPNARAMNGHNLPLATLGAFLLWFGWFGFNGGSALAVNGKLPLIFMNTNLAAAAGGMVALIVSWTTTGKPQVGLLINGALGGLVGITASCNIVSPAAAILIGAVSGTIAVRGTQWLEQLQIDDVVGAVPVHAFCGAWGTLAVALLGDPESFGTGLDRVGQLAVQAQGVAACFALSFGGGWLMLKLITLWLPLRVDAKEEHIGLNVAEHGAATEIVELLTDMHRHQGAGDFTRRVAVEPHTEVGQIATEYNRVLDTVCEEMQSREQAVEALRQTEARYRSIFENAVEGIFQTSPDGHYLAANPALARLYGYDSPDELMRGIEDISNQLYVDPRRRDDFVGLMREQGQVMNFESEIRRRDGSRMWISENARTITDERGQIIYYEGTVVDIGQRKRAEELAHGKKAAEAASAAKSEFLANMSHEIRTPLNGVIGMLDLLAGTQLTPQQARYAAIGKSSADSLLGVINQILDFSKIEAGKLELEQAQFNLHTLIEEACDLFVQRITLKGLELACLIESDVPVEVIGDAERLRQILVNLVNNAIKFTERGEVVVRVRQVPCAAGQTTIRIEVRDTGIGIPADRLDRLFQSFSQVDASTTRRFGGTGLGLAISRRLAQAMGGDLRVESAEGAGSTFSFDVKLGCADHAVNRPKRLPTELHSARVLVVDDNATNREVLSTQLTGWQMEATCACDAPTALAMLREAHERGRPFALAVMDHQMPDMDGLELAASIRQEAALAGMPMLLLTSSGLVLDPAQLRAHGLVDCLTKPVRQSRLFDTIVEALAGQPIAAEQPQPKPAETAQRAAAKREATILVAEDNEVNQIVVSEILNRAGFACEVVENGRRAVESLEAGEYDLVLMDCQMPELDGFEATRTIRSREADRGATARTPIIALTASAIKGDRERCLDVGMDGYVTKPIDPAELIQAIELLLGEAAGVAPAVEDRPAPPAEPRAARPAVDRASLAQRCMGDSAMIERVVGKFARRAPELREAISQAAEAGDMTALAQAAHSLKGMAGNLSADELAATAGALEEAARSARQAEARKLLPELARNMDRALTELVNAAAAGNQPVGANETPVRA